VANQWTGVDIFPGEVAEVVDKVRNTVLILHPEVQLDSLGSESRSDNVMMRSWCLWELFCTVKSGAKFTMQSTTRGTKILDSRLQTDIHGLLDYFKNVDFSASKTTSVADRSNIVAAMEEDISSGTIQRLGLGPQGSHAAAALAFESERTRASLKGTRSAISTSNKHGHGNSSKDSRSLSSATSDAVELLNFEVSQLFCDWLVDQWVTRSMLVDKAQTKSNGGSADESFNFLNPLSYHSLFINVDERDHHKYSTEVIDSISLNPTVQCTSIFCRLRLLLFPCTVMIC
jgi:hypothetical protein